MRPILCIDGRNAVYRAVYSNQSPDSKEHHIVVFLRFIRGWITKFKPIHVNIFWDSKNGDLWRKKLLSTYKNRESDGVKQQVDDTQETAWDLLQYMNIRQFIKGRMEADDLIYSACRVLAPSDVIIISSDNDYLQVPYRMPHVKLYNVRTSEVVITPDYDPAIQKALMGDTSDTIDGYDGIGKIKSEKMARDVSERMQFLVDNHQIFIRNMMLIDLSLNPFILENDLYIAKILSSDVQFDKHKVMDCVNKYKLHGLASEWPNMMSHFKSLGVQ